METNLDFKFCIEYFAMWLSYAVVCNYMILGFCSASYKCVLTKVEWPSDLSESKVHINSL